MKEIKGFEQLEQIITVNEVVTVHRRQIVIDFPPGIRVLDEDCNDGLLRLWSDKQFDKIRSVAISAGGTERDEVSIRTSTIKVAQLRDTIAAKLGTEYRLAGLILEPVEDDGDE